MRNKTKLTGLLLLVSQLLFPVLSSASPAGAKTPAKAQLSPVERLEAAVAEVDALLQKQQWAPAREKAAQLVDALRGSPSNEATPLLARSLTGLALAEAGLGHEPDAIWHWQLAQNVSRQVDVDLSAFGKAGDLLAAHPLRWWDEAPPGLTVRAESDLGQDGTPPRQVSGGEIALTGPLAKSRLVKWALVQVVIDGQGRVLEPVVVSASYPAVGAAAVEAVRDWRFEPARQGGQPVAVYHHIVLPARKEVPFVQVARLDGRLARSHDLLLARDWDGARKLARKSWLALVGKDNEAAAQAMALVALADAGAGNNAPAICRWQVAQYALPDLYDADLSAYGAAGQLLEENPWGGSLVVHPPRPPAKAPEGAASRPRLVEGPPPVYTEAARKGGLQGQAVLESIIDENGYVTQPRLLRSLPYGLDLAALDTVCDWRFEPARFEGKPIRVYYSLQVDFRFRY